LKKLSRKTLVNKLDTAHSKFIRARDKRCVTCGSRDSLQCGHLFTRAAYSTRWDISTNGNAHCQCSSCNLRHEYDAYPFNSWYIEKFGKPAWDALHTRHKAIYRLSTAQMAELLDIITKVTKAVQTYEENLGYGQEIGSEKFG